MVALKGVYSNGFSCPSEVASSLREVIKKKVGKSGQADRFKGWGGSPPAQPDRFYL